MTPDRLISTKAAFGKELTRIKARAGLTVREIAKSTEIPSATLGGYFAGKHLPPLASVNLPRILRACRADQDEADVLLASLHYLRKGTALLTDTGTRPTGSLPSSAVPSILPPIGRLAVEPRLRGRRDLISTLRMRLGQRFSGGGGPSVHVLHGLGGCGKSAVALALADIVKDSGTRVWWITSTTEGSVLQGMQAVMAELGASREMLRLGTSPDDAWRLLNTTRRAWLLVFDEVDDPARAFHSQAEAISDGVGWLREIRDAHGAILVTTRDGSARTWGNKVPWLRLHRVDPLDPADGALILSELAGNAPGTHQEAVTLARRLGGLPLALRLVGRFLDQAGRMPTAFAQHSAIRTYADCCAALDEGAHEELFIEARDDRESGISDQETAQRLTRWAWERSLDLLTSRELPEARTLIQTLSCIGATPIPYTALLRADLVATSPLFCGITGQRLWRALTALAEFGLIELFDDGPVELLTLHPLIRDGCRRHRDLRDRLGDHLALWTRLLDTATSELDPKNPIAWRHWSMLAEHCLGLLEMAEGSVSVGGLRPVTQAVRYLRASGNLSQGDTMSAVALERARGAFGDEHPEVLELAHEHGRILYGLGQFELAAARLDEVLRTRRRLLGKDHPDTLTTQHYRARVARDSGDLDAAERGFVQTLEARRKVLGADHPDTWTSMNNVADVLRERGRLEEAGRMLGEVLSRRRISLGEEHPATLVTLHHLARLRQDQGDVAGAVHDLHGLATLAGRVLGDEHPRTLAARHAHAVALRDDDRPEAAAEILERVLAIRCRILGENHPVTMATRRELGTVAHSAS